jgi:hypothetical protein
MDSSGCMFNVARLKTFFGQVHIDKSRDLNEY